MFPIPRTPCRDEREKRTPKKKPTLSTFLLIQSCITIGPFGASEKPETKYLLFLFSFFPARYYKTATPLP